MSNFVIEVEERTSLGKNESRRLRRTGMIPGVLYGAGKRNFPVSVDPRQVEKILNAEAGENTLLDLKLKGQDTQRKAMIRDYQSDPVSGDVLHADFIRIEMDTKLQIQVPVRTLGTASGVKEQGGVLEMVQRSLDVECLPGDIPEHIDIDVSAMNIGDQVRLSDMTAVGNIKFLQADDTVVVTLVAPRIEEEEVVAEGEEGAEPEVISKGKDEAAEGGEQDKTKGDS